MNISAAKKQVANAVRAYLVRDEFGEYALPLESQRPVFLMGPPGIGKTAIMAQIAHELDLGLVSYSMTHHTRQSALGLPYITDQDFGGETYRTSHYTMSEIIASVFEAIEATGREEGILFLDEINCVSETLAPAMLQFLQFKTFGTHRVPAGWIIVTAGNPPEYNNSVREFDIVTWDRLKRVDIEPDYNAWKAYALESGVHPSVTTYLEMKKSNFYKVESVVEGKRFVTARGWVDLARMIELYEHEDIAVDVELVSQYLQDPDIAHDFANYYQIFNKYKADYQVGDILAGTVSDEIVERASKAPFDEKLSLIGMICDGCMGQVAQTLAEEATVNVLLADVKAVRDREQGQDVADMVRGFIDKRRAFLQREAANAAANRDDRRRKNAEIAFYEDALERIEQSDVDAYETLRAAFKERLAAFKEMVAASSASLNNSFTFFEAAFDEGNEILIFVTELTANESTASFISSYGCEKYFQHNKELLFYERQKEIITELADFDI